MRYQLNVRDIVRVNACVVLSLDVEKLMCPRPRYRFCIVYGPVIIELLGGSVVSVVGPVAGAVP